MTDFSVAEIGAAESEQSTNCRQTSKFHATFPNIQLQYLS